MSAGATLESGTDTAQATATASAATAAGSNSPTTAAADAKAGGVGREAGTMTVSAIHGLVEMELENEGLQSVDPDTYTSISKFIGGLKDAEYEYPGNTIRDAMIAMASGLATTLIRMRLAKGRADSSRLLEIERYALDAADEGDERSSFVVSAVLKGRTTTLESVSRRHARTLIPIRFLSETDEFMGIDMKTYGPYMAGEMATIPRKNALNLVASGSAARAKLLT